MPEELPVARAPLLFRVPLVPERDVAQMRLGERHQPPGAPIAGRHPGFCFELRDLLFERHQRIELELLLGVPAVGHMRHERAQQAAARAGADRLLLDQPHLHALARRGKGGPQPHDAGADDQKFAHRLTFSGRRIIAFAMTGPADPFEPPAHQNLDWHEGDMPYSREFGDHFYCRTDGRLECGHVFLSGNGLPHRWVGAGTFRIGELGFGTGLNFCETWRQWKMTASAGDRLHFVSFERFPMAADEISRALSHWPEIDAERQALVSRWPASPDGDVHIDFGDGVTLTVVCGPALEGVARAEDRFNAWYLDGFAPRAIPTCGRKS